MNEERRLEEILREISLEEKSVLREEIAESFKYLFKVHHKTMSYKDILKVIKYIAEDVYNNYDLNKNKGDDTNGSK